MRKIASAAVAVALAGVMALPAPASAQSASFNLSFGQQDRFVGSYCDRHPNWRGCDDWRGNHKRWGRNDYRNWYMWNRSSLGSLGAGIFGFAIGAALANSMNNSYGGGGYDRGYDSHVARCEARFRSYSAETDMYLGYDGDYHRCRL
jgi:hypothetical protein